MPMYTPASLQSASNLLFRREKKDEVAPSLSAAYRKRMQDDPRYGRVSSLEEGAMNHIPNSGWAGAIAQAFNGYLAGKERRDLEKDYTGQQESRKGMIAQLLANEPNLDPMVRQMAQDPDFGDMALMSVFKQKMDPKEATKYSTVEKPDGTYAWDPTHPDAPMTKLADAKPKDRPTKTVEMVGSQGPGNYVIYEDTGEEVRKAGGIYNKPPSTIINNNNSEETAFSKEFGKNQATNFNDILTQAQTAPQNLARIGQFRSLSASVPTGKVQDMSLPTRQLLNSVGITDDQTISGQEALQSVAGKFVLDGMNALKGPATDKDAALLASTVPQLSKTPGGNAIILDVAERVEQYKMAVAEEASNYVAQNGSLDAGWIRHYNEWSTKNPLLTPQLRNSVQSAKAGKPAVSTKPPAITNIQVR